MGSLTMLEGPSGGGKSLFVADLAARLSQGSALPGERDSRKPSAVLFCHAAPQTQSILHRLSACGADLARIVGVDSINSDFGDPHCSDVCDAVERWAPALIVVDSMEAWIDVRRDVRRSVRKTIAPLLELACRRDLALLMIAQTDSPKYAQPSPFTASTVAATSLARSVLVLAHHPIAPDRRVLFNRRNNLRQLAPAVEFQIESSEPDAAAPRIVWNENPNYRLDEPEWASHPRTAMADAVDLLLTILLDGPKNVVEVQREARRLTISPRTLRRAKKMLGIESIRSGFGLGSFVDWRLPADPNVRDLAEQNLKQNRDAQIRAASYTPGENVDHIREEWRIEERRRKRSEDSSTPEESSVLARPRVYPSQEALKRMTPFNPDDYESIDEAWMAFEEILDQDAALFREFDES